MRYNEQLERAQMIILRNGHFLVQKQSYVQRKERRIFSGNTTTERAAKSIFLSLVNGSE